MNRYKKILAIIMVLLLVIINSGCWDRRDFEKFILIKGIGVDLTDKGRVKFTVQVIVPTPGEGGGKVAGTNTYTTSATGYSLYDANRNLVKQLGKKPFYGLSEIILFSDKVAKKGIAPYLDYFIRDPEIRGRSSIIVTKQEAEKVLKADHGIEPISSTGINTMVDGLSVSGAIITMDLIHFLRQLFNDTTCAVASLIELRKGNPKEGGAQAGTEQELEKERELLYTNGGCFFVGAKCKGHLSRKEARGLNWITTPGDIRGPVLIQTPHETRERKIAIEVLSARSKIKPEMKNGEFKINLYVNTIGLVTEDMSRNYDITQETNIQELNKRYATVVNNEIRNALKKTQAQGADVFGFGEAIFREFPHEFLKVKDNWGDYYKMLPVEIDVTAQIRRQGMVKEGVGTHRHQ